MSDSLVFVYGHVKNKMYVYEIPSPWQGHEGHKVKDKR